MEWCTWPDHGRNLSLGLSLSALLQHYHSCPFPLIFHRLANHSFAQVTIVCILLCINSSRSHFSWIPRCRSLGLPLNFLNISLIFSSLYLCLGQIETGSGWGLVYIILTACLPLLTSPLPCT